jgi:GNAT superfamily N-acetyltransferase
MNVRLVCEQHPSDADMQQVRDALDNWNVSTTGHRDYAPLAVLLRDEHSRIRGGAVGNIWARWLHVSHLWVDEVLRRHGHGSRLLAAAEELAAARGCEHVHLDTFSFQAGPDFYRRRGYEVFGVLPDHPPGGAHYFLRKSLRPPGSR